jgi:hypothetical protein
VRRSLTAHERELRPCEGLVVPRSRRAAVEDLFAAGDLLAFVTPLSAQLDGFVTALQDVQPQDPELVRGVAAFSAGTYTMPASTVPTAAGQSLPAPLPYGIADVAQRAGRPIDLAALAQVPWLIGAGANDNRDGDVPRQWDPYEGTNRVQRAQRFAGALTQIGAQPQVVILPNTDHEVTAAMLDQAFTFFDRAPRAAS